VPFNKAFARMSNGYVGGVTKLVGKSSIALVIYGVLIAFTVFTFMKTPGGFVPQQDKLYLVAVAQLPDASTIDRTEGVIRKMSALALKTPGVEHAVAFPGLSVNGLVNSPNAGALFLVLDGFDKRKTKALSADAPSPPA
jgi:multidrug efflux pump subunit AcrB